MASDWDPMLSDYQDPQFNAYMQGVGRDLANGNGKGTKMFVDNFPVELGQDGFYNLFSEFGHVLDSRLKPSNREDGKLTYGFITMDSPVAAEHAISQLNGRAFKSGARLIVKPALSDEQKKLRLEKKQREAEFMANLGRTKFHRDDDMMSSVSALPREDLLYEQQRALTAQAKALLERTGQAYDLELYTGVGRGHRAEIDIDRYRPVDRNVPLNYGRGRAHALRDSLYLRGLGNNHEDSHYGPGGRGRGRGRGWDGFDERSRAGPVGLGQRMNGGTSLGRGLLSQHLSPPKRPKVESLRICLNCGDEGSAYRCQACKSYYCSHECQRKDWPRHKDICLDISVHNFNSKYNPQNGMDLPESVPSIGKKPIQSHQQYQDDSFSSHSGGREFPNSHSYHSDHEEGGKLATKGGKSFKQNNRGYESEAGGGGYNNMRNQSKQKSYNKQEDQKRNSYDNFETNHSRDNGKGRYQERNSGFKGKDEERDNERQRKEDRVFHNTAMNKPGGYKGRDKENDRDGKVSQHSSNYDRDTKLQKSQTEKREFDNKKRPPLKFDRKDPPNQDKREAKNRPLNDFNFNTARESEKEKKTPPKQDKQNAYKRSEERRENLAETNLIESIGSVDASCDLISQTMEDGKADKCYITHYESPSKFWIALSKETPGFFSISEEFKTLLLEMPDEQVKKVKAGELYCMIDEGFWARVKVVTVKQAGNLTVFFPDVGKQQNVHISKLFHLDATMRVEPAQAMCCCIGYAKPKSKMWSDKASSVVCKWLGEPYNKEINFKVLEKRGSSHALKLTWDGENLADVLISQGLAEASVASANLPRFTDNFEEDGAKASPEERFMVKDLKRQTLNLEENEKVSFDITEITSMTHFIGNVVNSYTQDTSKQVCDIINTLNLDEGTLYSPLQGELVLAKYLTDNVWYRAQVLQVQGGVFQILFLDYGNQDEVQAEDIRKMECKKLTTIPPLAVSVQLWNVDQQIGDIVSSEEFKEVFSAFKGPEKCFSMVVKGKRGSTLLVDFVSSDKEETLTELLNEKLASKKASTTLKTTSASSPKKDSSSSVSSLCPDTLPRNVDSEVLVQFVQNCSSFYVLHKEKQDPLTNMMVKINTEVTSFPVCDNPRMGGLVVATFEGVWYRAQITKVISSQKCEVFYVDYGNCAEVSTENLRQFPKWASSEPAFAIHCSLDIDSVQSSNKIDDGQFKELEQSLLAVSVLGKDEDSEKYVVKMMNGDGLDILQLLTQDLETQAKSSSPPAPSNIPDSQAASPPSQLNYTMDDVPVMETTATKLRVITTNLESLSEFCCQPVERVGEALEITTAIREYAANIGPAKCTPVEGGIYGCLYGNDWYRCVVQEVKGEQVRIYYIDYGNCEDRPITDLIPLQPEHLKFPVTLMKCQLQGLKIVDSEKARMDEQHYIRELVKKLIDLQLWVEVMDHQGNVYKISASVVNGEEDSVDIVEDLINIGIGEKVQDNKEEEGEDEEEEEEDEEEVERRMKELQKQMEQLKLKKNKKK